MYKWRNLNNKRHEIYSYFIMETIHISKLYFINTSKSVKKIRSATCHYTPVAKYQNSSKCRGCRKKSWLRMMNLDKVICIGYLVEGYKKNNNVFLHWQHREKCPEVIKTYNNRCANLILCKKMYHYYIHV
jgi:hypothetical protein